MFAESENVTSPIRLCDGSVSFPSTYRALISSSRNLTVSSTLLSPMLPDVSTAIMMSEPSEQSADSNYNAADIAANDDNNKILYLIKPQSVYYFSSGLASLAGEYRDVEPHQ